MIAMDAQAATLQRINEIRELCPDLRLGQLLATLGLLGEDATGHSLWEIEDSQFAAAVERLAGDLNQRRAGASLPELSPPVELDCRSLPEA